MPLNSSPVTTTVKAFEEKLFAAEKYLHTNCGFWGGVVPGNENEIEPLIEKGVLGFKAFLTHSGIDDFPNVTESDLRKAMPVIAKYDLPLLVHCELTDNEQRSTDNQRSYQNYLSSRPKKWEDDAIALMIRLCGEFNCRVHIVHLSSASSIEQIKNAKQKYQKKNLSFLEGSALHIPVQSSSIDVIISFETIEHLEEQGEMMKEFKRVLKPNGKLLISSPAKEVYHLRDPENPYHLKELATAEFRELCSRNFKFCDFYTQRIIIGSLIRSSENSEHNKDVIFYDGDYNRLVQGELIQKDRFFNIPFFNLALCSDDNSDKIASSFFDASKVIRHDLDYYSAQVRNYQTSSLRKLVNRLKHLKNILKKVN